MTMPFPRDALEALHARGAPFVLCRDNKHPLMAAWPKVRPDFSEMVAYAGAGELVGAIPGSLGCCVVDVDDGGSTGLAARWEILGAPITVTHTRREGGRHVWYRASVTANGSSRAQPGTFAAPTALSCSGTRRRVPPACRASAGPCAHPWPRRTRESNGNSPSAGR